MNAHPSEPTQEMLDDPVGIELVDAIHRRLGNGRSSAADCTCPRSSNGHRRGINITCPWDGINPQTFKTAPTIEPVREREPHPVHIPEHLRDIVREAAP